MKKLILKTFIISLVSCFTVLMFMFAVKARNWLTASPGDKLSATKFNQLIPQWAILAFNLASCPTWRNPADWTSWNPDLRWVFLRWANSFGWTARSDWSQDPDCALRTGWVGWNWTCSVGSLQPDQFKSHSHNPPTNHNLWMYASSNNGNNPWITFGGWWRWSTTAQALQAAGWNETRPKNVDVIYCIKN